MYFFHKLNLHIIVSSSLLRLTGYKIQFKSMNASILSIMNLNVTVQLFGPIVP